jgi:hypothetical protein
MPVRKMTVFTNLYPQRKYFSLVYEQLSASKETSHSRIYTTIKARKKALLFLHVFENIGKCGVLAENAVHASFSVDVLNQFLFSLMQLLGQKSGQSSFRNRIIEMWDI